MDGQTVKSTVINSEKKTRFNLGDYCVNGGPGRKLGGKNKFTLIKEQMAEIWSEEEGKKKFKELFKDDFPRALDKLIAILPKEKEEISNENHFHLTVVKFEKNEINEGNTNTSSRVHGIDSPMAT